MIIYTRDLAAPRKKERAIDWLSAIAENNAGVVSVQVLNEAVRAFIDRLDVDATALKAFIVQMAPWCTAPLEPAVVEYAIDVRVRWRFSWWDSLIVASALFAGSQYLLTEDMHDEQNLDGMIVLNPFSHEPASFFAR